MTLPQATGLGTTSPCWVIPFWIGADQKNSAGDGKVYVFHRTMANRRGPDHRTYCQRRRHRQPIGRKIALDGNRAVITAHGDDHSGVVDAGSAYVFERHDNGTPNDRSDDTWTQAAKLTAGAPGTNDEFGRGVDIEGDTIVIGAWSGEIEVPDSGAVYFFEQQGAAWVEQGVVTPSDAKPSTQPPETCPATNCSTNSFGAGRLSLEGNVLVAGDGSHDQFGVNSEGFIFVKSDSSIVASDLFESNSFDSGLGQWASDGGWTTSGDASIRSDANPHSGDYHARLRRSSGDLQRVVDVSGEWSPTNGLLSHSFEGSDQARVQVSGNGSSWTTLKTFVNGQDDNQYHFFELDVPDVGDTLHIRFDAAMSGSRDYWYIDNVEVLGKPASLLLSPMTMHLSLLRMAS